MRNKPQTKITRLNSMTYHIYQQSRFGTERHGRTSYTDETKALKRVDTLTRWYAPEYQFFIKEV